MNLPSILVRVDELGVENSHGLVKAYIAVKPSGLEGYDRNSGPIDGYDGLASYRPERLGYLGNRVGVMACKIIGGKVDVAGQSAESRGK